MGKQLVSTTKDLMIVNELPKRIFQLWLVLQFETMKLSLRKDLAGEIILHYTDIFFWWDVGLSLY